jgi:ADP-dependent NAD(P)H-hydrate dehydratase / NAD(P)H-hydrate epimerase
MVSIDHYLVTADQMRQIEGRLFGAGMPIAALMEKVGILLTRRIQQLYPRSPYLKIGVLVGTGHNGGDALVVARELHLQGYRVLLYAPQRNFKELTEQHWRYTTSLGLKAVTEAAALADCDVLIEGLFGFGLNRSRSVSFAESLQSPWLEVITEINGLQRPIISIDLPAGLDTDSGEVLGAAIVATRTLCLGLWKRAFAIDAALPYLGQAELIDFGLPIADITAVLGSDPQYQRMTADRVWNYLRQPRSPLTHKYQQGHLLLVVGSRQYGGAAILAALGAQATGVGMLSIAVPASLRDLVLQRVPEAIVIACPETPSGAIQSLPELDGSRYQAIAIGCGLTVEPVAVVSQILALDRLLVLDADALNIVATLGLNCLKGRQAPTILTPHLGELRRLCPNLTGSRFEMAQQAAVEWGAIVLFKGARTIVADPTGRVWSIAESTPALARGGSGDVLAGMIGGLWAQDARDSTQVAAVAAGWHGAAAILAVGERGDRGVDGVTLSHYLAAIPNSRF